MNDAVLLAHLVATLAMTGLIWFVQIVHYPLMAVVGVAGFREYEERHTRLTTLVVAPLMLTEVATAIALVLAAGIANGPAGVGLGLLTVIWASTAALQVPCHRRLARGFDVSTWRRLVRSNWLRTAAWTARSVVAVGWLNPLQGTV